MQIPVEMVENYFQTYAGYAKKQADGSWVGCCPVCHEGKSWGRKKRLFYDPEKEYIYCHNCSKSWKPLWWMVEVSGKDVHEVLSDAESYDYCTIINMDDHIEAHDAVQTPPLPYHMINLSDERQINYYRDSKVVIDALSLIKKRRLDKAVNVIDYGVSLKDFVHKNRLIIPFKDITGEVIFYQSRALYDNDLAIAKYLSKANSVKSVFGIDKLDSAIPYMFVTEGPIDSCFIKNGVSMAGLVCNPFQEQQLGEFFMMDRIWVLDNDFRTNKEVLKKYVDLIRTGQRVFIWPDAFNRYKDINEICVDRGINEFPYKALVAYSYSGEEAKRKLVDTVKRYLNLKND